MPLRVCIEPVYTFGPATNRKLINAGGLKLLIFSASSIIYCTWNDSPAATGNRGTTVLNVGCASEKKKNKREINMIAILFIYKQKLSDPSRAYLKIYQWAE